MAIGEYSESMTDCNDILPRPLGTVEKVPSVIKSARRGYRRDPAVGGMAVRLKVRTGTPPRRDFASSTSPVPTKSNPSITGFSTLPLGRGMK